MPTNALMGAIQLGIANSIGSLASKPKRDLLLQDFDVIETVSFPPLVPFFFFIVHNGKLSAINQMKILMKFVAVNFRPFRFFNVKNLL